MRGRTRAARLDPSSGGAWQTKGPGATQSRVIRARNESVLAVWQVPDAHPLPSRRGTSSGDDDRSCPRSPRQAGLYETSRDGPGCLVGVHPSLTSAD